MGGGSAVGDALPTFRCPLPLNQLATLLAPTANTCVCVRALCLSHRAAALPVLQPMGDHL